MKKVFVFVLAAFIGSAQFSSQAMAEEPPVFSLPIGETTGSGEGQFLSPRGVAIDDDGNVYVADTGNNRIQKFDLDGNFIKTWGSFGNGDDQFYQPRGIAVDLLGEVYVADHGNHRIQKFDSEGSFLTKLAATGGGEGQFYLPTDVAVDSDGDVYVSNIMWPPNSFHNRVQKFAYEYAIYTPVKITAALVKDVVSLNTKQGIINSLDAKLNNVISTLTFHKTGHFRPSF